jgi:hypothetical protein
MNVRWMDGEGHTTHTESEGRTWTRDPEHPFPSPRGLFIHSIPFIHSLTHSFIHPIAGAVLRGDGDADSPQ